MFEKEAKEYAQGMAMYYESAHGSIPSQFEKYLRKAVEYGYNKANEWNYPSKGELPKEDIYIVIKLNDENTCYKYCTGFWEKEKKCFHTLFCNKVDTKDIIAWKEIVDD